MFHNRVNAKQDVEQFLDYGSHSQYNINLQNNIDAEKRNEQIENNVRFVDFHVILLLPKTLLF